MPRYIDVDLLIEILNKKSKTDYEMGLYNHHALTKSFITLVERQPTTDVVPKSEVDELAEEHSDLIVEKDQLFDEVVRLRKALDEYEETSGLKKAKSEVAMEIFEEIEKKSCVISETNHSTGSTRVVCYQISAEKLTEIKKKYTEVEP